MNELRELINNYPISLEELKIFTEWCSPMGKWGENLNDLLIGIYPCIELNNCKNIKRAKEIRRLSDKAMSFVNFWNKSARRKVQEFIDKM